jgi:hypothetical protein
MMTLLATKYANRSKCTDKDKGSGTGEGKGVYLMFSMVRLGR